MIKSILQTWKGKDIQSFPPLYKICQPSWQEYNPEWKYVMFDDNDIDQFVKTNFPVYYADIFCKYGKIILKVDIFRCLYLFKNGGVYSDMDSECLRPLDDLVSNVTGGIILGQLKSKESLHRIPNATMISRDKGEMFWLFVVVMAIQRLESDAPVEYKTGPVLLTTAVSIFNNLDDQSMMKYLNPYLSIFQLTECPLKHSQVTITEPNDFYPICWITEQEQRIKLLQFRPFLSSQDIQNKYPTAYVINYWTHFWS